MAATIEEERLKAIESNTTSMMSIFKGKDGYRLIIASWPKIMQQFVGLSVFNTYSTYFCKSQWRILLTPVQLAGNKDPFTVTMILACVQLISVLITALCTDNYGRRPLTVYPYIVTTVSVLCLGIVGCFNYASPQLGSLLVRLTPVPTLTSDLLRVYRYIRHHWSFCNRLRLPR